MSEIKKSLEENKDAILESLPAELHANFEAELAAVADVAAPSADDEVAAIKAVAAEHPDVDESVIGNIDPAAHRAEAAPSAEEQEAAMKEALANVGGLTAPEENEEAATE